MEQECVRESVKRKLSRMSRETAGKDVRAEAEETPLLEAVTREQLVKTQQTENT
jgi:DNA-binding protein Fis